MDIDTSILKELKRRQKAEGKTLGQLVSGLLAKALAEDEAAARPREFSWIAAPMTARIDIEDKDALYAALDRGR